MRSRSVRYVQLGCSFLCYADCLPSHCHFRCNFGLIFHSEHPSCLDIQTIHMTEVATLMPQYPLQSPSHCFFLASQTTRNASRSHWKARIPKTEAMQAGVRQVLMLDPMQLQNIEGQGQFTRLGLWVRGVGGEGGGTNELCERTFSNSSPPDDENIYIYIWLR